MEEWVPVKKYSYKANALFAVSTLEGMGLKSSIQEIGDRKNTGYEILVESEFANKAIAELKKLDLDETPVGSESDGSIEGLEEWNKNMYNPGYYTGGRIPPFYLDKSNWNLLIPLFLLLGTLYIVKRGFITLFIGGGIFMLVGLSMFLQLQKRRK